MKVAKSGLGIMGLSMICRGWEIIADLIYEQLYFSVSKPFYGFYNYKELFQISGQGVV